MRRLLIERWHHFGYLVISTALLGFGASGPLLALVARRVRERPGAVLRVCAVGLCAALVVMPRVAALMPVEACFIPQDLWRQVGWWSLYWLAALVPFWAGATLLGASLMVAGPRVGRVYAANLVGSGLGAVAGALVLSRLGPEHSLLVPAAAVFGAVALLAVRGGRGAAAWLVCLAGLVAGAEVWWPLRPAYDQHKYGARLEHLAAQGAARRVAARADPYGYVELWESPLFHDMPFLALTRPPPPMYSLVINGDPAGSVLRIGDAGAAAVLDETLMALPYRLVRAGPRVLLVGEVGGTNVWLARRRAAARVDVVQPNAAVQRLLRTHSAAVFDEACVRWHARAPRAYVDGSSEYYDLIQLVGLEGLGSGGAGVRGLAEDHLLTVEGLAACLRRLDEDGVLAVSRGLQQPPRENIRLLATLAEAFESLGVAEPRRHIVQVRDYLGVCTLASRRPLDDGRRALLRAALRERNLTPVWYDGLPDAEANRPDVMPGPADGSGDWLHYAAAQVLAGQREAFYEAWLLDVRPARDDRPFFWDFYKPEALAALKGAYGELWLTRAELGRLFLYASCGVGAVAAVVLIVIPLVAGALSGRGRSEATAQAGLPRRRDDFLLIAAVVVYFGGIGAGFMGIEMALISRVARWLGDPVQAGAVVIGGLLVFSGVGSAVGVRIVRRRVWLAAGLVAVLALVVWWVGWRWSSGSVVGLVVPAVVAAVAMGLPLPAGLAALECGRARFVPWAWGINGVASVLATSVALVGAMVGGYGGVLAAAAGAYGLAAVAAPLLGRGVNRGNRGRADCQAAR